MSDSLGNHENEAINNTSPAQNNSENIGADQYNYAPTLDETKRGVARGNISATKKKSRKRNALALIFSGTGIIGLVISFFTFFAQPLQIIHFAETLKAFHLDHIEELSDIRHMRRLRNFGDRSDRARTRRLGIVGNLMAESVESQWKSQGIELDYNKATGRLRGFKPTNTKAQDAWIEQGLCERPCAYVEASEDMFRNRGKNRRLLKKLTRAAGIRGVGSIVQSRIIQKRYALNYKPGSSLTDKIADRGNEGRSRALSAARNWHETTFKERTRKFSLPSRRVSGLDNVDETDSDADARSKIRNQLSGIANPLELFSVLCTVRELGQIAADEDVNTLITSTLGLGQGVLSFGEQVKTGDYVIEELEVLSTEQFWGDDPYVGRKTSWVESDSIRKQTGAGVAGIEPTNEYAQFTLNQQGNAIDSAFSSFPDFIEGTLGSLCDKVLSFFGQLAFALLDGVITITGVGGAIKYAAGEIIAYVAGDRVAGAVLGVLKSEPFPEDAVGGLYGYGADFGVFNMANQVSASMGGVPLTPDEERARVNTTRESVLEEFQDESFATRYFDLHNVNSLSSQIAMRTYTVAPTETSLRRNFGSVVNNIFRAPLQLFGNKQTSAIGGDIVTQEYFQTPRYGLSYEALESPQFDPREPPTEENPDGWPLPDGFIAQNLATRLDQKVAAEASSLREICLLTSLPEQCEISPDLHGDAGIDVLNNNMDPEPIGYERSGSYIGSWHSQCFGAIAYDNADLYNGMTRWFQRDDGGFTAYEVGGESSLPDECDSGEGVEITIDTDEDYRAGRYPWGVDRVTITLDEEDWLLYRAYTFTSAIITGEGCALSSYDEIMEDGTVVRRNISELEDLCAELGFGEDDEIANLTTDEAIRLFASSWSSEDLEDINPDLIFNNSDLTLGGDEPVWGDHNIPCSAGSQSSHAGSDPFGGGVAATFNVCDLGNGITVNSSISANIAGLIAAAAADGVNLGATSSIRSRAEQEYFWNCYQTQACNNGNLAARPGFGNHEAGFAIDFTRPSIVWLQNNPQAVADAGLSAQVESEDWHFSVNGR